MKTHKFLLLYEFHVECMLIVFNHEFIAPYGIDKCQLSTDIL